ncbi:hypothetical protein D0863_15880 [Hortaea werneckii]|uniref:BZIP domain-containing protein n=1 Tax=Hortaea werneckii TaxID=91943 RepID=A0A3M7C2H7_HORWE|nr:hypothetical protein D0863_15880 [Hortaea werneckii]
MSGPQDLSGQQNDFGGLGDDLDFLTNTDLQAPFPHQTPTFSPQQPITGDKRKASAAGMSSPADFEENARVAAEEDKRRRNTAASARFRVKKKQREAELEKRAKEMTDKVQQLEGRVQQLETENQWLKGLITERGSSSGGESITADKGSEGRKEAEAEERSPVQRTEGVGTEQAESEQATV